jgi:glycosyltransferase involved in cell wall biosynthesis
MNTTGPKVSVIIPTYNSGIYLRESLQSVLCQTYSNFEVIVINDASTDNTDQVIAEFSDPRILYFVHSRNRYAAAARNTGIRASTGEYIAFLDVDDVYDPKKLEIQVAYMQAHPEVGLSYSSRIEMDENKNWLTVSHVQAEVMLKDLIMGYPFAPTDVMMKREWVFKVGLFDENLEFHGEDPDFHFKLALEGCIMKGVHQVLTYRRLYSKRMLRNLENVFAGDFNAFYKVFSDPRCPEDILSIKNKALAEINKNWSFIAFSQNESEFGRKLIHEAIRYDAMICRDGNMELLNSLMLYSIRAGGDHEAILLNIIAQLPDEFIWVKQNLGNVISEGYLFRSAREIFWGRLESGNQLSQEKLSRELLGASFYNYFSYQLLFYSEDYDLRKAETALRNLCNFITVLSGSASAEKFKGMFLLEQTFRNYDLKNYSITAKAAIRSILAAPANLANRGFDKILLISCLHLLRQFLKK